MGVAKAGLLVEAWFKRIQFSGQDIGTIVRNLNMLVNALDLALNPLLQMPSNHYAEVRSTISAGNNVIAHKLGRQPQGWQVVDATGGVPALYRYAWTPATITLTSSGTASITLRVW